MTESETLCNGKWLRLKRSGRWEYAERTNPGGGVMVIALTPQDRLLFVEQYRPAIGCKAIEMPAGLVGDLAASAGESAITAAHRELIEETGYRAAHMQFLMEGPTSAGMSNEIMAFVLASGLQRVGPGGGDESEEITLHEVPRAQATRWLLDQLAAGFSIDPKIFAGLYMLETAGEFLRKGQR
ncbi:NUDIX hydrolase [Dokdonella sp.]|uniref:NUDIX hydrolase n=1 Tax=Dokdonella sp. TaxID=2291710 RepID=UPI0031C94B39|nr:NUDIX hydrolase [Dokdonella sp.]